MPTAVLLQGFVIIDNNFKPSLAVPHGKPYMEALLRDWEYNYHKDVDQTFNRLRKEYL